MGRQLDSRESSPAEVEAQFSGVLPSDRDRIVLAMIECCAERGYAETTVEDVLERADVRPQEFERLFADLEACGVAAVERIASAVATSMSSSPSDGGEPGDDLAALQAILELMAARPSYAAFACVQARQGGTARMREAYESAARALTVMIERLRSDDLATVGLPPRAARAALGGAEAVVRREVAAGSVSSLPKRFPGLAYGVLAPLVGQEEALRQSRMIGEFISDD